MRPVGRQQGSPGRLADYSRAAQAELADHGRAAQTGRLSGPTENSDGGCNVRPSSSGWALTSRRLPNSS